MNTVIAALVLDYLHLKQGERALKTAVFDYVNEVGMHLRPQRYMTPAEFERVIVALEAIGALHIFTTMMGRWISVRGLPRPELVANTAQTA